MQKTSEIGRIEIVVHSNVYPPSRSTMAAVLFFEGQSVGFVVPSLPLCTSRMTTDILYLIHAAH
jgi:hypothetical protein